jgi:hypothetical protein
MIGLLAASCLVFAGAALPCASGSALPSAACLLPNHPNPFNPNTSVRFVLPARTRVTITVHDAGGRVVATLVDDVREAGAHEITWNANGLASGIYFAHLRAGTTNVSRKMVLLK